MDVPLPAGFLNPSPVNDSFAPLATLVATCDLISPNCFRTPYSRKSPNKFIIASLISSLIIWFPKKLVSGKIFCILCTAVESIIMTSEMFMDYFFLRSNKSSIRLILCSTSWLLCIRSVCDDVPSYERRTKPAKNSRMFTTWCSVPNCWALTLKSLKIPAESALSLSISKWLCKISVKVCFFTMQEQLRSGSLSVASITLKIF